MATKVDSNDDGKKDEETENKVDDLEKLKIGKLKTRVVEAGLKTTGKKSEFLARLREAINEDDDDSECEYDDDSDPEND